MPINRQRRRRRCLSRGDESFHSHPAKHDDLPKQDSRRPTALPRPKSTGAVFDAFSRSLGTSDCHMSNVALEQTDIVSLRKLAQFLKTTGPPPDRPLVRDDCLRLSSFTEPRRWSLQSLRRNKRLKPQKHPLKSPFPESAVPDITIEGHRHIAISTPVPRNSNAGGPWFRSQYPIFLPQSPPQIRPNEWLERTASEEASFSTAGSDAATDRLGEPHRSTAPFVEEDHSYSPSVPGLKGAHTGALASRTSIDYLLRAMLNTAAEGLEYGSEAYLKQPSIQTGPGAELPHQTPEIQLPLPLVTTDKEKTRGCEGPRGDAHDQTTSTTKLVRANVLAQSHSSSPSRHGSPSSYPGGILRRPANLLVQTALTVPRESSLLESPGFPNMLATITFPSPPMGSRPSSTARNVPPAAGSPRRMVQPRTSSWRACTSAPASAASLDEIVMQKKPSWRDVKSEGPAQVGTMPRPCAMAEAPLAPPAPIEQTMRPHTGNLSSLQDGLNREIRRGLAGPSTSTGPACERRVNPSSDCEECQRESLASQATAMTDSYRQSIRSISFSRSSSASDASSWSRSAITLSLKPYSKDAEGSRPVRLTTSERWATLDTITKTASTGKEGVRLTEKRNLALVGDHEPPTRPSLCVSTTNIEADPQPESIREQRLVRKAIVRGYKMRDLDASRVEAADSPILGYFAPNFPQVCNRPVTGSSPLVYGLGRPSTVSRAPAVSHRNNDADVTANLHHGLPSDVDKSPIEVVKEVPSILNGQLKMSPVVVTDIEPIYPPINHLRTSGITISPIMVIANVAPRPGSSTVRLSALARPESPSPRIMVRPKPLKIAPQSRQKPHLVTISRNPSTGAIERTALRPMDPKSNRRSLITMPTLPMSSEAVNLSRRLSLPPVQLDITNIPSGGPLASLYHDRHSLRATEQERESKLQSMNLKERILREKRQKEKEISDIVAKAVGLVQKETVHDDDEGSGLRLEQHNAENLEKRLRRLERNNDAWICAMKPLLEAMSRTLDDMRQDEGYSNLRMSDFIIDMDGEGDNYPTVKRQDMRGSRAIRY